MVLELGGRLEVLGIALQDRAGGLIARRLPSDRGGLLCRPRSNFSYLGERRDKIKGLERVA